MKTPEQIQALKDEGYRQRKATMMATVSIDWPPESVLKWIDRLLMFFIYRPKEILTRHRFNSQGVSTREFFRNEGIYPPSGEWLDRVTAQREINSRSRDERS